MTIANNIIYLSLRNSGVNGIGQTPMAQDVDDTLSVLNDMINQWNLERRVKVNPISLPGFPDLTTDVSFWTNYEHVLLVTLSVRLRQIYSLPPIDLDVKLAMGALQAFQAINLQQVPASTIAQDDGTGFGVLFLALRAAGRVSDEQGVLQTSQDMTDAQSLCNEMLDEWQRERTVRVIPGTLSLIADFSLPLTMTPGEKNAVVLNLACRLRDAFGAEVSKTLAERADKALTLLQAINLQQNPATTIAADDGTGYGILFLALRAAGRVNDNQGVDPASQDVTDAASLMTEMIDEWQRMRTVRVIPGTLPLITDLTVPLTLDPGVRNAIVLNLAIRLRDAFGSEVSKTLLDRAAMALDLIQAINLQQQAPVVTGVPNTVRQALYLALRMSGRINDKQGVSETSADMNDAQSLLVMMLGQWQRKRWLVWNEDEASIVSTGNQWYSIGPGQDFDTARPDKIHAAWCRLKPFGGPMPVDLPLAIIEAKEDWAHITIKDLHSLPSAVFYDSSYPVGRVTFWPVPIAAEYELHLVVKASLPVYVTLDDPLNVPPEYLDAIINNLAVRIALASPGATQVSPLLLAQARASLNTIRLANSQISLLHMPAALVRGGGDVSSWSGKGLNQAWTLGGSAVLS